MVVGDDAGDGLVCGRGQRFCSRGIPDSGDGPGTPRGISKRAPAANSCRVTLYRDSNTVRQTITPGTAPDGPPRPGIWSRRSSSTSSTASTTRVILTSNGRATPNAGGAPHPRAAARAGDRPAASMFEPRALDGTPRGRPDRSPATAAATTRRAVPHPRDGTRRPRARAGRQRLPGLRMAPWSCSATSRTSIRELNDALRSLPSRCRTRRTTAACSSSSCRAGSWPRSASSRPAWRTRSTTRCSRSSA